MSKFIDIDQAVASASTLMKNPSKEDRDVMKFWIWLAEKQIGTAPFNKDTADIEFVDCVAKKPANHLKTIDIALYDNHGNDLIYTYRGYNKRIHDISSFNNPELVGVYEDEFCLHVDNNNSSVDRCSIIYWAYPVDEDGNPLIPEEHIYAIMRFVKYMMSVREGNNMSEQSLLEREWKLQASKVRGQNSMPNIPEARDILQRWMTLIPRGIDTRYNLY